MADSTSTEKVATEKKRENRAISPVGALFSLLRDYFMAIMGAALVAFMLRIYVIEAFRIPADFMSPALIAGDDVFVNKVAYAGFFGLGTAKPNRGDVVVFSFPTDATKDYIKRVIGVGGDVVEIREGRIYLNDKPISEPSTSPDIFNEELGGRRFVAHWEGVAAESRKMMPVKVPEGQVFLLGDNRSKGPDSREWGFLPATFVKGKAAMVLVSVSGKVHWDRMFKRVE